MKTIIQAIAKHWPREWSELLTNVQDWSQQLTDLRVEKWQSLKGADHSCDADELAISLSDQIGCERGGPNILSRHRPHHRYRKLTELAGPEWSYDLRARREIYRCIAGWIHTDSHRRPCLPESVVAEIAQQVMPSDIVLVMLSGGCQVPAAIAAAGVPDDQIHIIEPVTSLAMLGGLLGFPRCDGFPVDYYDHVIVIGSWEGISPRELYSAHAAATPHGTVTSLRHYLRKSPPACDDATRISDGAYSGYIRYDRDFYVRRQPKTEEPYVEEHRA